MEITTPVKSAPRFEIQVDSQHYDFGSYVTFERWLSYRQQIIEVTKLADTAVLYVGVGDGIVPAVLRSQGYSVELFDFDEALKPNYCGSVEAIDEIVGSKASGTVVCCQVLEHLPFDKFRHALRALSNTARTAVVLSLPQAHYPVLSIRMRLRMRVYKSIDIYVRKFWKTWRFDGEHHWEIGAKGYSRSEIDKEIRRHFEIGSAYIVPNNPYHIFYVLRPLR